MTRSKNTRRFTTLLPALLALLLAGGLAVAAKQSEEGLMAADRAFGKAAARDGLDGWMSFMADDAVRFTFKGPLARGKEAVREVDAAIFANPAVKLTWEPTDAGLYSDGKTGFTRGDYRVLTKDESGSEKVLSTGVYLTMWRLEKSGWKVILDTGQPDQGGPAAADGDDNEKEDEDEHAGHDHGDH